MISFNTLPQQAKCGVSRATPPPLPLPGQSPDRPAAGRSPASTAISLLR